MVIIILINKPIPHVVSAGALDRVKPIPLSCQCALTVQMHTTCMLTRAG